MRVLHFDGEEVSIRDMPMPSPAPGEALIKVLLAGLCRTDIEIVKGYMKFSGIPGHEFVGLVEECEERDWMGRRVVGDINIHCGKCSYCKEGLTSHCPDRSVLGILNKDGAFAEYITLPSSNLHDIPNKMDNETAVFVEPVAACYEIIEQVDVKGARVAVLGDGKLGILAARVLRAEGAGEVVLVGKHREKMALAETPGIDTMLAEDFEKLVRDPHEKYPLVIEATGRPQGIKTAIASVRPRGTIVQKTTIKSNVDFDISRLVVDEVTIIGSRCGPFEPAIEALSSGKIIVKDLIAGRYILNEGRRAFKAAMELGALKMLIQVND